MTLGFAAATWLDDQPVVMVASDARISAGTGSVLTDVGVKTYELGGACAAVASGAARPPMMAAEVCRSVVEHHNRSNPKRRVNFVDTVRLFGYFLKRTASAQEPPSQVAVAGYFATGAPCLALVTIAPGFNKAGFISFPKGSTWAVPVGASDGKVLLLRSIEAAKQDRRPRLGSPLAMLHYIAKHAGAFKSVGGGIAVGHCKGGGESFSWPIIEIDGRRYLRGIDVTESYRPGWPAPEVVDYDDAWCAALDQRVATMDNDFSPEKVIGSHPAIDIDDIDPASVFQTHNEPPEWSSGTLTQRGSVATTSSATAVDPSQIDAPAALKHLAVAALSDTSPASSTT